MRARKCNSVLAIFFRRTAAHRCTLTSREYVLATGKILVIMPINNLFLARKQLVVNYLNGTHTSIDHTDTQIR